ncbi:Olfactory receptor 8U9 [Fukomys damarensis]|uniref:Olfactory receptor 8U9 n=1 Tax=Fukomys damarensis TaxID=885580 RepID=A0A091DEL2_FUKDA|nr:Olfactory receptor 8U9 [Fukomys damarensis]
MSALAVLVSYGYIIATVMKMHLTQALHSRAGPWRDTDNVGSVFYGAVIPMLNPIIYSLWNQEVKEALKS